MKISDHALVRYIERIHKVDVDQIKKQITDYIEKRMGKSHKTFTLKHSSGYKFIVKDGVLITVMKREVRR